MMTPEQIRLKQNPILTNLLLGARQGKYIAESLFPRLPQAMRGMTLATAGKERMQRYNLRRAPGADTRRIEVKYEGRVFTVDQYSVEVPIPRELLQEQAAAKSLNISAALDISTIAMTTASDVLLLDYEIEAAAVATDPATYGTQALALAGATKWSAETGTPVTDIRTAAEVIRKKTGVRPNKLHMSADAFFAASLNKEVKGYLPSSNTGPASLEQLKTIFNVPVIEVGDAVWVNGEDAHTDVWGNCAILSYSPAISGNTVSLAEPSFGFTSVLPGHPFAEQPYYDNASKSWIYGATFERRANLGLAGAGFLFQNCK